jgi:Histidine kinase-, DNA gyrase B-, and HSP90-like ATPase
VPGEAVRFHGQIKVAARIIDYLSSGLYHTPAACLKELINNSYDAAATTVNVFVKPDANRIIIEDDGVGMSRSEFVRHFDHISESHKRDSDEKIEFGRSKIGKIGIGFIAANEICDRMELYSTKKGNRELLHVNINFAEMRKPAEERRVDGGPEYVKADYDGEILPAERDEHYTKLFLTEVRGEAREILAGARHSAVTDASEARSLYGLTSESIAQLLRSGEIRSWKGFDAYSETLLQVGLNVPVPYHQEWMPSELAPKVKDITRAVERLNFAVRYDGTEVRKPIAFPPRTMAFVDRFQFEGDHIAARGYFYVQHGTIMPRELQGLLVRIRHAAVGEYDSQFWGFAPTEASLIQRWVSAEVYADDRLETAMNIDRRTLRLAHPAYVELQNAIHNHLRAVLKRAREKLYSIARETRKEDRELRAYEGLISACREELRDLSPRLAKVVEKKWSEQSDASSKVAAQKLSVLDLYELVIATATEVLDEEAARRFVARLTEKLLS